MTTLPELPAQDFGLELDADLIGVGFRVDDPSFILRTLVDFSAPGMPERAVDKRRAEFLAGRLAAAHALQRLGAITEVKRTVEGAPRFPEHVVGSISHGAGRALCVVAAQPAVRSLGIDAERLLGHDSSPELHLRICEASETAALAEAVPLATHRLVTLIFSAKESLYKCLWPLIGKFMDFSAAKVVAGQAYGAAGGLRGTLELELSRAWSTEFESGARLPCRFFLSNDHVETLVVLRPSPP